MTDWSRLDLFAAASYAQAAERLAREAQESLALATSARLSAPERLEATLRPGTDASFAAVALYLAASSTVRYCLRNDAQPPLPSEELDELVAATRHVRDYVMHWDDKRDDSSTRMVVSDKALVVTAPSGRTGKRQVITAQIDIEVVVARARTLHDWASNLLLSEMSPRR